MINNILNTTNLFMSESASVSDRKWLIDIFSGIGPSGLRFREHCHKCKPRHFVELRAYGNMKLIR